MSCEGCKSNQEECATVDLQLLDETLDHYKDVRGSTIAILQKTQEIYGYLPRETFSYIAEKTGMREAQLYGVATFYAQFRMAPIGKNLIMLCQGTACHVNGADNIQTAIQEELKIKDGETTEDGVFTLMVVACLGCCSLAPVMMIGEETHAKLTPESTIKILRQLRSEAQQEVVQ